MTKHSNTSTETKSILNSDNTCIISITKQGNLLAQKLLESITTRTGSLECYTLRKFSSNGFKTIDDLSSFFREAFQKFDTIIAIMATGIVVRHIAPFLKSKIDDPGVIVLDVNGTNTISLLSGHVGNANENTMIIAKAIGSNPVITTASDNLELKSVDIIAKELNLRLVDFEKAKQITSLMLQKGTVTIFSDYELPKSYNNFRLKSTNKFPDLSEGKIIISEKDNLKITDNLTIQLYPKIISVGIGAKRNIDGNLVIEKIQKLLKLNNISQYSIRSLATIEDKKDEQGILFAKKYFDVDLEILSKSSILQVEDKFMTSEFVRKTVGVGSVSEACGYLSSNQGKEIGSILREDGMVISLWKRKSMN